MAIPIWQDRISPVLDAATRLLVVTRRHGVTAQRREVILGPLDPEALAQSVAELHVNVVLCAALSEVLRRALSKHGVRVRSHLCGEVDAVLHAFCCRRLTQDKFRMPGCWGRHTDGKCCPGRHAARRDHIKQQPKAA